jgi:hypothetical protein
VAVIALGGAEQFNHDGGVRIEPAEKHLSAR